MKLLRKSGGSHCFDSLGPRYDLFSSTPILRSWSWSCLSCSSLWLHRRLWLSWLCWACAYHIAGSRGLLRFLRCLAAQRQKVLPGPGGSSNTPSAPLRPDDQKAICWLSAGRNVPASSPWLRSRVSSRPGEAPSRSRPGLAAGSASGTARTKGYLIDFVKASKRFSRLLCGVSGALQGFSLLIQLLRLVCRLRLHAPE